MLINDSLYIIFGKTPPTSQERFIDILNDYGMPIKDLHEDGNIHWCQANDIENKGGFYTFFEDEAGKFHGAYGISSKNDWNVWHQQGAVEDDKKVIDRLEKIQKLAQEKKGQLNCDPKELDKKIEQETIKPDQEFFDWPIPDQEMFQGIAGEFVNAAVKKSEADPVAVLITFLSRFGIEIGRNIFQKHPSNQPGRINAVLVGDSGAARKGTSAEPVMELFKFDPSCGWQCARTSNGPLSSGEGIIEAVKDTDDVSSNDANNPGNQDDAHKRLFIMEGEFASALVSMKRRGNTLSNIIRCMYDGHPLAPITKTNKISATGHHVAIIAHITQDELLNKIPKEELYNGFVNRFLWICVRRSKLCPFPEVMDQDQMIRFRTELLKILLWTKQNQGQFCFTKNAMKLWEEEYSRISIEKKGLMSHILSRTANQAIRLALIYAVLDCSKNVHSRHLNRALSVCKFATDSAHYIFGELDENQIAKRIVAGLKNAPQGLMANDLYRLFHNHVRADVLNREINLLINSGSIFCEKKKTQGRPAKMFLWRSDGE